MSQTSYPQNTQPGHAGDKYDISTAADVVSRTNTSSPITMGVFVTRDTNDNTIKYPTAATDITDPLKAVGVTLRSHNIESGLGSGPAQYPQNSSISVLKKGRVWVTVEENVSPNDSVFVRFASGAGGTQLGSFRKSADTASSAVVPNAKYITSAQAGGVAVLDISL